MTNSIAENANLPAASGEAPAGEGEKELAAKLKHRERARAYYLRHRDRVREKARNAYYRKREGQNKAEEAAEKSAEVSAEKAERPERTRASGIEKGNWGILALFALLTLAVVAANEFPKWWNQQSSATPGGQGPKHADSQQGQQNPTASPTGYHPFDIGGGRIIQVRNSAG